MHHKLKRCGQFTIASACILLVIFYIVDLLPQDNSPEVNSVEKAMCRWPPTIVNQAYQWPNGFDISVCVRPSVNALLNDDNRRYLIRSLFRGSFAQRAVSFEDLAELPRKLWRKVKYTKVYNTYPQDVPLRQIVSDIKAGNPVSFMPKYNFPIRLLATSKSVCHAGSKHDLVVIIKSSIFRWESRSSFRHFMRLEKQRYPHLNVGYVFSLGVPRMHGGRLFDRDGHVMNLTGPDGDQLQAFEGRTAEVMIRIYEEITAFNDIVMADYEDTYYNLTFKSVTNYRWMSAFCGSENVKLFMTIDDDHRVNLSMVDAFMKQTPEEKRRNSLFGYVVKYDMAYRSPLEKLYLSYREFPWDRMCPYLRGFAQLIGPGVVDDIAIATAYTRYNYAPEDVFLGMVAFKLQIPLFDEKSMFDHDLYVETNKEGRPAMVALSKHFP
ncbi:Lactosylceramide 13-N-acetyl-beta-D-glucosaminyltransferase A [Taenia crassiceps]|uniref:Hexosyltransferase n=1 Tax=Taenia crassiceps TaxID=6207 RepID=A0ABR4Q6D8_9CEST